MSIFRTTISMVFFVISINARSVSPNTLLPDSSNFVKASLLTVSPTSQVYSVFGHTAIRMECPTHRLDYVFSFESDADVSGFITFFAGKAKAAFIAVPTRQFIEDVKKEGRGLQQYELNLTLHEKQRLWQLLDEDMMEGAHRKFNLLLNNCVSMTVDKLHRCAIGEDLQWAAWQGSMLYNNGDLVRHNARRSKWAEFLFVSFLGTGYEDYYDQELRLCPEIIVSELQQAAFVNAADGSRRKVLTGEETQILPAEKSDETAVFTPTLLFGLLLLAAVVFTLAERRWKWTKAGRVVDFCFFTAQTAIGVALLYITFVSEIFGLLWNWYLIPFNPLPFVVWTIGRKNRNYGKVWAVYAVILGLFLLATPFIGQLDLPHQFITAALLVRCLNKIKKT